MNVSAPFLVSMTHALSMQPLSHVSGVYKTISNILNSHGIVISENLNTYVFLRINQILSGSVDSDEI